DGNCEAARAINRGCGSRHASPDAQVMAGRKLAPRGRADGAGRNRTGHSRTLTTILPTSPAEQDIDKNLASGLPANNERASGLPSHLAPHSQGPGPAVGLTLYWT